MKRRALLSTLAVGLAGCASTLPGSSTESQTTTSPPTSHTDTHTTTHPTTGDQTTALEPADIGVPASETDCPVHGEENTSRVVCWPAMADSPLVLSASGDSLSLPTGDLAFTLRNDTETTFTTNFYDWRVRKRVDGEWYSVAPRRIPVPAMMVDPAQSHTWTLTVDNADTSALAFTEGTADVTVGGLGGGEYAFTAGGWFESTDHEHQTALAARFSIEGPAVELEPSEKVTGTTRDGDVVTVDRDLESGYNGRTCEYRVTRVESAADPYEFITEQVLRMRNLRDALAFFESGVETVRFVEENGAYPPFGIDEARHVAYDGQTYEITSEELESE
ncbi:hypothetical protein [Haloarchaeobius amylolyticus]|uniref:hypothetical protein n=1 Tax=Haloarchaeobius amylolyticus TaxID=1198296 RepID=UPI00227011E2|nr:hypothetical protein [Haloarchaeobius amylolyticus]